MNPDPKSYWKSLGQLAGDRDALTFLDREFPAGASELPEGVTRRELLMLLGASVSLAGLAGCRRPVEKIVPYVSAPEDLVPGIPEHYATTLPAGHHAYGLVVLSHEGRPTKIEGNELHPSTAGSASARIQASILDLYDPDRSHHPLSGEERKSWADFTADWGRLEAGHLADGGAGLAVLAGPSSSPTEARLRALFHARFPRARVATYESCSDENIYAGVRAVTGRDLQQVQHLDRAKVVVALDADFLLGDGDSVRHSRGFADGRRVQDPADSMNRLYVVEGPLSLTGANADHRLRLRSSEIPPFVLRLVVELAVKGLDVGSHAAGAAAVTGGDRHWVGALADDLLAHRGESLILAGRGQSAEVHAAVLALNVALGNVGTTLTLHEIPCAARARGAELAELAAAMRSGSVSTLVILGGNPIYEAPVDLDLPAALAKVGSVIHLGDRRDETALRAGWHLPRAHYLESWGDAAALDGTLSVVQPLILPLYEARSAIEVLGLLATGTEAAGYDLVRETWRGLLAADDFEKRWRRVLHDGLLQGSAAPAVSVAATVVPLPPRTAIAGSLEVTFVPSATLHDGRSANNGWLLELPDPITKLTWQNAALVAPATAERMAVTSGDVVRLAYEGREIEAPVLIVPGQAESTIVLPLGWGRTAAGRVGSGRGFDAFSLRTSSAPWFGSGLTAERVGRKVLLATTQDHHTVDELGIRVRAERVPTIVREATIDDYRREPEFAREMVEHPPLQSPWHEHSYDEGYQWGMSIDLTTCNGCNACVTACQSENNIPIVGPEQVANGREMHWVRVDRYFRGDAADPETVFQPVPCMHCENAPCEQVCPVAATVHDAEGLNTMVYNRCIGTRYCSNNCPYKVRRFNFFNFTKDTPEVQRLGNNPNVTVRSRGVMEKCTYCVQRINAAKIAAKLAGREVQDGEVQTACQQACPTKAIAFGNIRDPASEVARRKGQPRDYALLGELNNKPRTTFLAKLRNPNPRLARPKAAEGHG